MSKIESMTDAVRDIAEARDIVKGYPSEKECVVGSAEQRRAIMRLGSISTYNYCLSVIAEGIRAERKRAFQELCENRCSWRNRCRTKGSVPKGDESCGFTEAVDVIFGTESQLKEILGKGDTNGG